MTSPALVRSGDLKCSCCHDTGRVLSAVGEWRPCSRCKAAEFIAWADARACGNNVDKP